MTTRPCHPELQARDLLFSARESRITMTCEPCAGRAALTAQADGTLGGKPEIFSALVRGSLSLAQRK
jgi:hypothetical protein